MSRVLWIVLIPAAIGLLVGCTRNEPQAAFPATAPAAKATPPAAPVAPTQSSRVVHVFVALCDNQNQGIVKVPTELGNGQDPAHNLYWGALYGAKTFFRRSADWEMLRCDTPPASAAVRERVVFASRGEGAPAYVVADAYDGAKMREALTDFLTCAAGNGRITVAATIRTAQGERRVTLEAGGDAGLVCFVGHNGLMDAALEDAPARTGTPTRATPRHAVVLACKSDAYFRPLLEKAGCTPLLTTTGLMAPEAYTLDAAIRAWAGGQSPMQIHDAAAAAYVQYQKCPPGAAKKLFRAGE
jgi:hypothetical protein